MKVIAKIILVTVVLFAWINRKIKLNKSFYKNKSSTKYLEE